MYIMEVHFTHVHTIYVFAYLLKCVVDGEGVREVVILKSNPGVKGW